MRKNLLLIVLGMLLGALIMFARDFKTQTAETVPVDTGLEDSFQALAQAVGEAGEFVQGHQWYGSPREQAESYRHILRALIAALEIKGLSDTNFPFFYELDPFSKGGMDNSDQRYLITMVDGSAEYRVWGHRGSSRRLDFTLYEAGSPMAPSFATLTTEQLLTDREGNFELYIGGTPREGNWLPGNNGTMRLLIRQIHSDWPNELPGQIHIDRVDAGRPLYPLLTREKMEVRLRAAADAFADAR